MLSCQSFPILSGKQYRVDHYHTDWPNNVLKRKNWATDCAARPAAATKRLIQSVSAAGRAELSAVSDQLSACQLRTPFANITPQLGH
jgi:hypothetical protein